MNNQFANNEQDGILVITSYPPRECGIATYSQDLIKAMVNKFSGSFSIKVCALELNGTNFNYPPEVKYVLKSSLAPEYEALGTKINLDETIKVDSFYHFIRGINYYLITFFSVES